jgi:hypothetical protein
MKNKARSLTKQANKCKDSTLNYNEYFPLEYFTIRFILLYALLQIFMSASILWITGLLDTVQSPESWRTQNPEDGKGNSFRNDVFFRIPGDGQIPNTQ